MNFFRQINKRTLLLLSILFSLSLLCAQGVTLHIHNLDHDNNDHSGQIHAMDKAGDHRHLSRAHFVHDTSHRDHHDSVISEVDISPDGVWQKAKINIFAIALVVFFFTLVMFVSSRRPVRRFRESIPVLRGYYILSPPLRAPPQHQA